MYLSILFAFTVSFLITLITIPPVIRVSKEKNLFDEPNHRKLNKTVIPNLGGVSIFIGATLSSIMFMPKIMTHNIQYLFAGLVLMLFVGLKDDIIGSSARNKFFMQILAALVLILFGNMQIDNLYNLFLIGHIPTWISIPLSLIFYLFIINAMNLIDGIDGLAAGISILFLTATGTWFYFSNNPGYAIICSAFIGSLIAFLRFNLWSRKNKIFMGDTGSLIVGILIATLSIVLLDPVNPEPRSIRFTQMPLILLSLLIIPVTDTIRVFYLRIREGNSPFSPDMNHIHHVLIKSGLTHRVSSLLLVSWTTAMLSLSIILQPLFPLTFNFILILFLTWFMVNLICKRNNRMSRIRRMRLIIIKNKRKTRFHSK